MLVVEDNGDARAALRALLELSGHQVVEAGAGKLAVKLAVETALDVVLIDLGLPELDGFEVARQIRRRLGPAPRLIALSGYGDEQTTRRVREAGFDGHLVKPVEPERLLRLLAGGG